MNLTQQETAEQLSAIINETYKLIKKNGTAKTILHDLRGRTRIA